MLIANQRKSAYELYLRWMRNVRLHLDPFSVYSQNRKSLKMKNRILILWLFTKRIPNTLAPLDIQFSKTQTIRLNPKQLSNRLWKSLLHKIPSQLHLADHWNTLRCVFLYVCVLFLFWLSWVALRFWLVFVWRSA